MNEDKIDLLKGVSIEFYRINAMGEYTLNEHRLTRFLKKNNISICHFSTYKKMMRKESVNPSIYDEFFEKLNLTFRYDEKLDEKLHTQTLKIKKALECSNKEILAEELKKKEMIYQTLKGVYPYEFGSFFTQTLSKFFVDGKILSDKEEHLVKMMLNATSEESTIMLCYLLFHNKIRKGGSVKQIKGLFDVLPIVGINDILVDKMIIKMTKYRGEYKLSEAYAIKLVEKCIQENNIPCLIETYADLEAIYGMMGDMNKSQFYFEKVKNSMNEYSDVMPLNFKVSIQYYLCMCSFMNQDYDYCMYEIEKLLAYNFDIMKQPLVIIYEYILSRKQIANTLFKIEEVDTEGYSKVFINSVKYYCMKKRKVRKSRLIDFISNKIFPLLKEEEHEFETIIFHDEMKRLTQ